MLYCMLASGMVKTDGTGWLQSAAGLFEAAGKPDKAADLYLAAGSWEDAQRLADMCGSSQLHLSLAATLEGRTMWRLVKFLLL